MNALDAIVAMAEKANLSLRSLSKKMGKNPNYLSAVLGQAKRNAGGVSTSTLIAICEGCDYRVALIPKGTELPNDAFEVAESS